MSEVTFKVVIPARYASSRLPGKPLLAIAGRPMLQHVFERAQQSGAAEIVIATDDARIEAAATSFNASVCMTRADHNSGTERIAEVVAQMGWDEDTIVVNVQGDEPLIPPSLISQVASGLSAHALAVVSTLATPIVASQETQDPNVVKTVLDQDGFALYFSRAAIPYDRDGNGAGDVQMLRHIGLYAYRAGFLARYSQLQPSPLETTEKLEQLRVLWHGLKIHVGIANKVPGPGVDTKADLERVESLMQG